MNRRPWRRLALLRSARRRLSTIPPPDPRPDPKPLPPLEPPDDDREFLPQPPRPVWDPRPAA